MSRIADIGAAVIGTGFIGTVHVEALRRIGVHVRGVLGSTAGAGRGPGRGPRRPRAPTPRSTSCSPTRRVDVVHVTSPNDLHVAAGHRRSSRAGKPRRLREAAGDDGRGVAPAWSTLRRAPAASSTRSTSTSASTRSTSTPARSSPAATLGDVRLVTGRYFQDWLLHDTRLELAARARRGRRAPRRRRHRLALARPDDVRHRPAGRRR